MGVARFIAGDWGTSHLRLSLCDAEGRVIEGTSGPGVSGLGRKLAEMFASLTADWDRAHGELPAILCGMAGSTLGWRDVPYLACPVDARAISSGVVRFAFGGRTVAILPGLSCRNRLGNPDVVRGEETQVLGALQIDPALGVGARLLCLPGTHTKWILLRDGAIREFLTGFTGELFAILARESVLIGDKTESADDGPGFDEALTQVAKHPEADLIHLLFATRSRQVTGAMERSGAASYLSGLIVGRDIAGALRAFGSESAREIALVGAPHLTGLYARASWSRGIESVRIDGSAAAVAGMAACRETLFETGLAHA